MHWIMILFPSAVLLGVVVFLLRQLNQERIERQDLINHILRTFVMQQMQPPSHENDSFIPFPDGADLSEREIRAAISDMTHQTSTVDDVEGASPDGR